MSWHSTYKVVQMWPFVVVPFSYELYATTHSLHYIYDACKCTAECWEVEGNTNKWCQVN